MEKWKEEFLAEIEKEVTKAQIRLMRQTVGDRDRIEKTAELKKRIVKALREEPNVMWGEQGIWIKTKNHLLAHDVAKELGISLNRSANSSGINFDGECDGISINVYGMDEAAGCKIVRRKMMKEVEEVELVCNDKDAQK